MNLGKQIDSLLKRHPSVYVNGLGMFSRIHTPATFDSKRNIFLPPITFIEFDQFKAEGYDFLTYLQKLEQLNQIEAEKKLNLILEGVFECINRNGDCVLDSLGTLVAYGNSYVFKPLDLSGYLYTEIENEFYEETQSTLLLDNPIITGYDQQEPLDPKPEHEDFVSTADDVEAEKPFEEIKTDSSNDMAEEVITQPKESNSYIYGLVATVAILVLAGIYYYATKKPNRTLVEKTITIEVPVIDSNLLDLDTAFQAIEDTTGIDIATQDSVVDNIVDVKLKPEVISEHKYTIVLGTHKTLAQANDEAKNYNKEGHKSVRVLQPNLSRNLKRVIWDTYPTREKRDSALREVRKHYKEDAWGAEIN